MVTNEWTIFFNNENKEQQQQQKLEHKVIKTTHNSTVPFFLINILCWWLWYDCDDDHNDDADEMTIVNNIRIRQYDYFSDKEAVRWLVLLHCIYFNIFLSYGVNIRFRGMYSTKHIFVSSYNAKIILRVCI